MQIDKDNKTWASESMSKPVGLLDVGKWIAKITVSADTCDSLEGLLGSRCCQTRGSCTTSRRSVMRTLFPIRLAKERIAKQHAMAKRSIRRHAVGPLLLGLLCGGFGYCIRHGLWMICAFRMATTWKR